MNIKAAFAALAIVLTLPLQAEDWTIVSGKVYHDVKVVKTEPDAVTILHRDGGALIPLILLPPDLQQRFHYDPIKAQEASDARAKTDAESEKALEAEIAEAKEMKKAELAQETAAKNAAAAKARTESRRSFMPEEPAVLEVDKKVGDEVFNKPK